MARQDHRPGRATGQDRPAVVGVRHRPTDGAARQRREQVGGLAAGQVHEVRLTDRLRERRVVG